MRVLLTGASGFIGTSLVDHLQSQGHIVQNVDVAAPLRTDQDATWAKVDVMDRDQLIACARDFAPDRLVHLAARTDTDSDDVEDYRVNFVGTENALAAAARTGSRFILVSTQFVIGPGRPFEDLENYAPHTAYGESKVRAELAVRGEAPGCWSIARPTNIWGPWHLRYEREFWHVLRRGLYLHPAEPDPVRSYGYVGSVCRQISALLDLAESDAHESVIYVGDDPIPQSQWVDAFSCALRGRPARRVPSWLVESLAWLGDRLERSGRRSPITSKRFASMTADYLTPMDRTWSLLGGRPVVDLEVGVEETVAWLRARTIEGASPG